MCNLIASKSKDPSTKVGVVIIGEDNEILSTGFNGFPRGIDEVNDKTRWDGSDKYKWIVHAEANAVANAARIGVSLKGSTLYENFEPSPCSGCAGLLIQAGIKRIIGPNVPFPGKADGIHYDVSDIGKEMLQEVGMEIYIIK